MGSEPGRAVSSPDVSAITLRWQKSPIYACHNWCMSTFDTRLSSCITCSSSRFTPPSCYRAATEFHETREFLAHTA